MDEQNSKKQTPQASEEKTKSDVKKTSTKSILLVAVIIVFAILTAVLLILLIGGNNTGESGNANSNNTSDNSNNTSDNNNNTSDNNNNTSDNSSDGDNKNQQDAHTHTYGDWTVVKAETCTEPGTKQKNCACGDKKQESIPAAHKYSNGKCSECSIYDISDVTIFYVYNTYDSNSDTYNLYVSFYDSNNTRIPVSFTGTYVVTDNFNNTVYETTVTASEADYKIYPTQHSGDVLAHKISVSRSAFAYAGSELGYINYSIKYQGDKEYKAKSTITNLALTPFESITYSGIGDKAISNINLPSGSYSVTLTHNGSSNFIVKLYYGSASYNYQTLTNEIGKYSGTHAFYENDGKPLNNGTMQIDADGNWKITIDRIESTTTTNIKGYGDTVTGSFRATQERSVVTLKHTGKSNFITKIIDKTSGKCSYTGLTNEIGNYTGEKVVNLTVGHEYFFYVRADGEWSIDLGLNETITDYTEINNTGKKGFKNLKNYITSNGTYNSEDGEYRLDIYVDYSSDYTSKYTYYLTYNVSDDEIACSFFSYSSSSSSLVSVYFDNQASGNYSWTYVDSRGYQMAGKITAATFSSNTLLGYNYQNISNSTIRSQIRELSSIGVRLVLLSVSNHAAIKANIALSDFGFYAFP